MSTFSQIWSRALRGLRRERSLYVVTTVTLSLAFFALSIAAILFINSGRLADLWSGGQRISVFLEEGVSVEERMRLSSAMEAANAVSSIGFLSGEEAYGKYLASENIGSESAAFVPDTIEVQFKKGTSQETAFALAKRLEGIKSVQSVATYSEWNEGLLNIAHIVRRVATFIVLFVIIAALLLIMNTIRLSISRRRDEVEVMRLCGATQGFIAGPFVLEGALQGVLAAIGALVLTGLLAYGIGGSFAPFFEKILGTELVIFPAAMVVVLPLAALLFSAAGSVFCIRKYLAL